MDFGGGDPNNDDDSNSTRWDVDLKVPYKAQPNDSRLCAPACIHMWAKYDYSTALSPDTICTNTPGLNCNAGGTVTSTIPAGVNFHTATNDAIYQIAGSNEWDRFWSGQITSITNQTPVVSVVEFGHHVVLVFGGNYGTLDFPPESFYQWKEVLYHDPLRNQKRRAREAGEFTLEIALARQVISNQYKNQGASYGNQYGDRTLVLGDWRRDLDLIPHVP